MIPDPLIQPTVPLWPTVGEAFSLGRSAVYEMAARDALPVRVLRCGSRLRVATAELRKVLGLDEVGFVNVPASVNGNGAPKGAGTVSLLPATTSPQGRRRGSS